jgi:hypothetical protein
VSPAVVCAQPENLLYASSDPKSPDYNTIKVADFGLSKFVSETSQMKTTCGTVRDWERGLVLLLLLHLCLRQWVCSRVSGSM